MTVDQLHDENTDLRAALQAIAAHDAGESPVFEDMQRGGYPSSTDCWACLEKSETARKALGLTPASLVDPLPFEGGQTQETQADYNTVLRAICTAAQQMGATDERTVLACLWRAGVRPSGFLPDSQSGRRMPTGRGKSFRATITDRQSTPVMPMAPEGTER